MTSFARMPYLVPDHRTLTRPAIMLLWAIAGFVDEHGHGFPTHDQLAVISGVARNKLYVALRELEEHGHIVRRPGTRGRATDYRINYPKPPTVKPTIGPNPGPNQESQSGTSGPNPGPESVPIQDQQESLFGASNSPRLTAHKTAQRESAEKPTRRKPEVGFPEAPEFRAACIAEIAAVNPNLDSNVVFEKFSAHARTKDRRCRDWLAAARFWALNERAPANLKPSGSGAQRTRAALDNLLRGNDPDDK